MSFLKAIKTSRIWYIAFPIIIGNVAQNLLSITDTAFLGHLDDTSLGAAALGGVFYLAIMMLGMGFSIGVQIIIARRRGEKAYGQVGTILHHALIFMLPFALLLWCLFHYYGYTILSWVILSPKVLEATVQYFDVRIWGIVFGFMVYICQSFFIGIARTKMISLITCVMVVVNILFDWLLIFGHWGFEAIGIRGAALGSVMAEIAAVVVYISYIIRKKEFRQYNLLQPIHYSAKVMRNLLKVSIPASLQSFLSVASWFVFFVMVEKLGEQALAMSNIGRSLYSIFLLPVWGFSSAVNSLVSYSIGRHKPLLVYPIMIKVLMFTAVTVIGLELLIYTFGETVISVYTNIPELSAGTLSIVPAISISALFFGLGFVCFNTVSGTGNTHISLLIEIIGTIIYIAITILAVEVWQWGILYVWFCDGIYGVVLIICSLIYIGSEKWIKRKV